MGHLGASTYAVQVTDEALMGAATKGDRCAFESFYRRHRLLALKVAGTICPDEAEDAVQAAFLSAWRARGSYDPARGGARNWMMGVVRNRAIDAVRSRSRRRETSAGEILAALPDPLQVEQDAIDREAARELNAAVARLPETQRRVVELNFFAERSQTEIARDLGLPLGTVKGRSRAALRGLAGVAD